MPTDQFEEIAERISRRVLASLAEAPPVQRTWLTPEEAATYLGCDKVWLAKLRGRGEGPRFSKRGHRLVRYHAKDLDAWMRAGRIGGGGA